MTMLELLHLKREARLLSILMVTDIIMDIVQPAMLILGETESITSKVAIMSGNPAMMAWTFILCAILVIPYLFVQIFKPGCACKASVVRLACAALSFAGVVRVYMGYLSRNLDYETVTLIYLRNGIWAIALVAILAYTLNNKLKRKELKGQV